MPEAPGRIRARREIADLGIIQVDFENGIRLNLKKTDFKQNQVMANLVFGSGSASEPSDKPGLSQLTAEVVQESGLAGLTREELDRALAGKNTRVRFSVGEDRFMFKAASVSDEMQLLFQLLHAHILDTGFRQDAYALSMERFAQQYQELSRTVDGMARLHARRFFAGGDSRFGLPAYEAFRTLKLEDVRAWLTPALEQDALEISIAGDMDVNAVIGLASTYLGSLPERSTRFLHPSATSPEISRRRRLKSSGCNRYPQNPCDDGLSDRRLLGYSKNPQAFRAGGGVFGSASSKRSGEAGGGLFADGV